jgi:predicted acylesterase/phospholipase RssA
MEVMTEKREKPRLAFVAGGGAIKAYAFHVGVLRGLSEDGFRFRSGLRWEPPSGPPSPREVDTYVGSSAGACVVAGLTAGHPPEELGRAILGTSRTVPTFGYRVMFAPVAPNPVRFAQRVARRWRLGQLRAAHLLDVGGVVSAAGIERYFRRHVLPTNRFADLAPRLFLVATQVNGSRKVVFGPVDSIGDEGYDAECAYYDNVPISEALGAAVSLPPLFAPYGIANPVSGAVFHYYDGEVREPLSIHVARDAGAEFVIASSIWRPYGFADRVGSIADFGMATLVEQALHQSIEQKVRQDRERAAQFDRLLELLAERGRDHGLGSEAIEELQRETRTLLGHRSVRTLYVAPEPSDSDFFFQGSFRFSRSLIEHCIDAGYRAYRAAARAAPEFLAALDQAPARG